MAIAPGEDRRVRVVSLTAEGRSVLAQAIPLWEQAQAEVMQYFEPQQWQALLSLLSDLRAVDYES